MTPAHPPVSLAAAAVAIRSAWCRDTCDEADVDAWSPANPARGQCGVSALTLQDLLGGDLLLAEVLHPDGSQQGWHYWNRLPDDREVDLTREQFAPTEVVQQPRLVVRPLGAPGRSARQYLRLRQAVLDALGAAP